MNQMYSAWYVCIVDFHSQNIVSSMNINMVYHPHVALCRADYEIIHYASYIHK